MDSIDLLDLIAKKLNSGGFLVIHRNNLDDVTLDPKVTSSEFNVIALILNLHEFSDQLVAVNPLANSQRNALR